MATETTLTHAMPGRSPRTLRKAAVAFAALALVLLRPLCGLAVAIDAHGTAAAGAVFALHEGAESKTPRDMPAGVCCAIEDETLAKPADPSGSGVPGSGGLVAFAAAALAVFGAGIVQPRSRSWAGALLPQRPYYVRSARIRR